MPECTSTIDTSLIDSKKTQRIDLYGGQEKYNELLHYYSDFLQNVTHLATTKIRDINRYKNMDELLENILISNFEAISRFTWDRVSTDHISNQNYLEREKKRLMITYLFLFNDFPNRNTQLITSTLHEFATADLTYINLTKLLSNETSLISFGQSQRKNFLAWYGLQTYQRNFIENHQRNSSNVPDISLLYIDSLNSKKTI